MRKQSGPTRWERAAPGIRTRVSIALALGTVAWSGCAASPKPIFEKLKSPPVWPAAPKEPKVRYVGELRSAADLKRPPKLLESLGRFFLGTSKPDPLYGPRTAACTPDGRRLWVADPGGRCLHMFDLQDRTYRKIIRAGDSPLASPVSVCLGPDDSIYLCDSESVAIHRLLAEDGTWLESLRLPDEILRPVAVSYSQQNDELFVVDVTAHNVKVLSRDGQLQRILGRRGEKAGEFNFPTGITEKEGVLWIVDTGNHRVQGIDRFGEPVAGLGQAGDAPGDLALPKGVAVDSHGNVYVVDARFENVQIYDSSGRLLLFFGEEGVGPGEFWLPSGIYIDAQDRIWVCDSYNRRVQLFQYVKQR